MGSDCIITSAGVDWITVSSQQKATKRKMGRWFGQLLAGDLKLGYEPQTVGMYGFVGKRVRHATMAHKDGRALLTVSGERAQPALLLCHQGDSCARIDVQVTVKIAPGAVNRFLDAAERVARSFAQERGRDVLITARHGKDGNETVYIGSPKSDVLLRLYDKYREAKEERYRDCVRLEVQLRKRPAQRLWDACASSGDGTAYAIRVLFGYLERRGIDTSWIPTDWSYVRPPKDQTTKESVTLAWHHNQVAPSIKRMARTVPWWKMFHNLFEGVLTPHEMQSIISYGQMNWGD